MLHRPAHLHHLTPPLYTLPCHSCQRYRAKILFQSHNPFKQALATTPLQNYNPFQTSFSFYTPLPSKQCTTPITLTAHLLDHCALWTLLTLSTPAPITMLTFLLSAIVFRTIGREKSTQQRRTRGTSTLRSGPTLLRFKVSQLCTEWIYRVFRGFARE